jgi:hypothetical protein
MNDAGLTARQLSAIEHDFAELLIVTKRALNAGMASVNF